jgi:hypothetical protein
VAFLCFARIIITVFLISLLTNVNAQKVEKDSLSEPFAIGEIGPASSLNIKVVNQAMGLALLLKLFQLKTGWSWNYWNGLSNQV